ncbi:MAG: EAL domain-containing protein [Lachnospiraceae bacterium]|nr:EAL domain-containing protein [Lachnospiraceae bacterium]
MIYELINTSAFLIAAFLLCLTALLFTIAIKRTDRMRNKIYIHQLVFVMICSLAEIGKKLIRLYVVNQTAALVLLDGVEFLHSFFHILLPGMFCYYIVLMNGSHHHLSTKKRIIVSLPMVVAELLVLTNPFHQLVFEHGRDLVFHGGIGSMFAYGVAGLYMLLGLINLIKHRKALPRRRLMSMIFLFPLVAAGIVIQQIIPGVKCELFAISLMLLGVMLTLENEDDRMDTVTRVYNRSYMKEYLSNLFRLDQPFGIIAIRLTNYDTLMRLSGKSGVDPVMCRVADYLKAEHPWFKIFRASPTGFLIITGSGEDYTVRLSERIYVRFMEGLFVEGIETPITAAVLRAMVPGELPGIEDVLLTVDGALPEDNGRGIISGNRLAYLTRTTDLEEAMGRCLRNRDFSIWYQPVHSAEGLKPFGVKALLRMHDVRLGDVMPAEFIPQAERTGLINVLGDLVLEEVCSFIKSGVPDKLGYRMVCVNLSFVQFMQRGFPEHVIEIVKRYGVDPGSINFEITKPVTQEDFDLLKGAMETLKKAGFLFSMEDFGAGYVNVEAIFALKFDVVKIDRRVLWEAMKNELGRIVLTNSIQMIRQLDRKILVEGVEEREQIDLLSDMEVDYLQGYYFSKPVSREQMEKMAMLEDM